MRVLQLFMWLGDVGVYRGLAGAERKVQGG